MGKLSFLVGVATGYVLGARAGQQRYEQIKHQASKVWSSDPVQARVSDVTAAARTKAAPFVADVISDAAKNAGARMRGNGDSPEPSSPAPSATSATGTGTTTGFTGDDRT